MKKKIIIFGAGGRLIHYFDILNKIYDVLFVCDNDKNKWGDYENYRVCSPELLLEYKDVPIVIISSYEDEIYEQLENMGLKNIHTLYGIPREEEKLHHRRFLWNMLVEQNGGMIDDKIISVYYNWNDHLRIRKIFEDTLPFGIDKKWRILDYGFGCGTLALWGLLSEYDIYGIDVDQQKKEFYNMKIDELNYPSEWKGRCILYNGDTLPFETESFDLIFCDYVLEHVPDLYRSLYEIVRVCKKGGRIRLACPNYNASFEEHYQIDFGKSLHGRKEEFKEFLLNQGENIKDLENIYFVNMDDIMACLNRIGEFEIIDLNKDNPLSGISLLIQKVS